VLVTGAGGSIGSELCRQVARLRPARLTLVERSEGNLFEIDRTLREAWPGLRVEGVVADVGNTHQMARILERTSPHVLLHAAAHKHVALSETNACEAVRCNALATHRLGRLAGDAGVGAFVMLSTDKAVRPVSIMGATKQVAELVIQRLQRDYPSTRFVAVRFGNVMGSTGSVIPIFRDQIAKGGPVTVTHPDATRYFMTIPEAVQLVLEAGALGGSGEILVLDMGKPIRILDLARDLIGLSGLRPEIDVPIVFTGLRPGERLTEDLDLDSAEARTRHPKIRVGRLQEVCPERLDHALAWLEQLVTAGAESEVRAYLRTLLPQSMLHAGPAELGAASAPAMPAPEPLEHPAVEPSRARSSTFSR
jgi:FlaA1/EpsC-like NDP-sugar epimerase